MKNTAQFCGPISLYVRQTTYLLIQLRSRARSRESILWTVMFEPVSYFTCSWGVYSLAYPDRLGKLIVEMDHCKYCILVSFSVCRDCMAVTVNTAVNTMGYYLDLGY